MWVLSVDCGTLISVVQFSAKKSPDQAKRHKLDVDGDYLLIRARHKPSLEYVANVLDALYTGEVEGYARPIIDADPSADYKYRTIVSRDEWKRYLLFEADGIDYDSHVKEETVKRQPEPKHKNLYSALSATWSAWSKLQDTPPYGYTSYSGKKPDCKCGHTELRHTVKGDKCLVGWKQNWNKDAKKNEYVQDTAKYAQPPCDCVQYRPKYPPCHTCKHPEEDHVNFKQTANGVEVRDEHCEKCDCKQYLQPPKPAPAKTTPAKTAPVSTAKSAQDSAQVFESELGSYKSAYPAYPASIYGSNWDVGAESDDLSWSDVTIAEDGTEHPIWCTIWDGDPCICKDGDAWEGEVTVTQSSVPEPKIASAGMLRDGKPELVTVHENGVDRVGEIVNGVFQETSRPGESKRQRKARQERNRRRRRQAANA